MYDRLPVPDSEVVYFGFARDPGRRLLANGSSSAGSTATVVSSRSLTKPGFATSELLHFSEARCSRSPNERSPLQFLRFNGDSRHGILGLDIPIAAASARPSLRHSTTVWHANFPSGQRQSSTGNC